MPDQTVFFGPFNLLGDLFSGFLMVFNPCFGDRKVALYLNLKKAVRERERETLSARFGTTRAYLHWLYPTRLHPEL